MGKSVSKVTHTGQVYCYAFFNYLILVVQTITAAKILDLDFCLCSSVFKDTNDPKSGWILSKL